MKCVIVLTQMVKAAETTQSPTRQIAILLLPSFSYLTLASLSEPLFVANWLAQAAHYRWRLLSLEGASVEASSGLRMRVEGSIGDAVVTRAAFTDASGRANQRIEIRGEYLHVYVHTEKVTSNKPVTITRGSDQRSGDGLAFDNVTQQLDMQGRVRAQIQAR